MYTNIRTLSVGLEEVFIGGGGGGGYFIVGRAYSCILMNKALW